MEKKSESTTAGDLVGRLATSSASSSTRSALNRVLVSTTSALGASAADPAQQDESIKRCRRVIEVPKWRVVTIDEIDELEGFILESTENMNEDCYLKRHTKHEKNEQRIKRHDMRRQREENMRQKQLRGRSLSFAATSTDGDSKNGSKMAKSKNGKKSSSSSMAAGFVREDSVMEDEVQIYKRDFNESMIDGELFFLIRGGGQFQKSA
jgi:hypothetical protein